MPPLSFSVFCCAILLFVLGNLYVLYIFFRSPTQKKEALKKYNTLFLIQLFFCIVGLFYWLSPTIKSTSLLGFWEKALSTPAKEEDKEAGKSILFGQHHFYIARQGDKIPLGDTTQSINMQAKHFFEIAEQHRLQDKNLEAISYYRQAGEEDPSILGSVFLGMAEAYKACHLGQESLVYYKKALAIFQSQEDFNGIGRSYSGMGGLYCLKINEGLKYYEEAYAAFQHVGSIPGMASACLGSGDWFYIKGHRTSAQEYFKRAYKLYHSVGDQYGMALSLRFMGHLKLYGGELEDAKILYSKALGLFSLFGKKIDALRTKMNIATVETALNNYKEAKQHYGEILCYCASYKHPFWEAVASLGFGKLLSVQGQLELARDYLQKARFVFIKASARIRTYTATLALATVEIKLGLLEEAQVKVENTLAQAKDDGNMYHEGEALRILAKIYAKKRMDTKSVALLDQALAIYESHAYPLEKAEVLLLKARIYSKHRNKIELAREYAEKAFSLFFKHDYRNGMIKSLLKMGDCYQEEGNLDAAIITYARAEAIEKAFPNKCLKLRISIKQVSCLYQKDEEPSTLEKLKALQKEAIQANDQKALQCILLSMGAVYLDRGDLFQGKTVIEEAVSIAQKLGKQYAQALGIAYLGKVALMQGDLEKAESHLRQSAILIEDGPLKSRIYCYLAHVAFYHGQYDKMMDFYNQSASMEEDRSRHFKGFYLMSSGEVLFHLRDLNQFKEPLDKLEKRAFKSIKSTEFQKKMVLFQSLCALLKGKVQRSLDLLKTVAPLNGKNASQQRFFFLSLRSEASLELQQYTESEKDAQELLKIANLEQNTIFKVGALTQLLKISSHKKDAKLLSLYIDELEVVNKKFRSRWVEGVLWMRRGDLHWLEKQIPETLAAYKKSLELFKKMKNLRCQGRLLLHFGDVYLEQKNYKKAMEYFEKAATLGRKIFSMDLQTQATLRVAQTYIDQKLYDIALHVLTSALTEAENQGIDLIQQQLLENILKICTLKGDADLLVHFQKKKAGVSKIEDKK